MVDTELRLCTICGDFNPVADFEISPEVCKWCDVTLRDEKLREYICSYNDENTPDFESDIFVCWAENVEHAKEQCQNAYPSAFVAEAYLKERQ